MKSAARRRARGSIHGRAREKRLERVHKRQRCEGRGRRSGKGEKSRETGIKRPGSRICPPPSFLFRAPAYAICSPRRVRLHVALVAHGHSRTHTSSPRTLACASKIQLGPAMASLNPEHRSTTWIWASNHAEIVPSISQT